MSDTQKNMNNARYRKAIERQKKEKNKKIFLGVGLTVVIVLAIAIPVMSYINNNKIEGEDETMSIDQFALPTEGNTVATINTTLGSIKLRLFPEKAPKAVENFTTHAKEGYYDGLIFHRVIDEFMIQTGDPTGTGYYGESIWGDKFEDELTPDLSLFYGAVAMANGGPNTNGSQFFIVEAEEVDEGILSQMKSAGIPNNIINSYKEHGGTPHLDYRFTTNRHTVFGQVYEGLDVVKKIAQVETDENDKPLEDVKIINIEIEEIK